MSNRLENQKETKELKEEISGKKKHYVAPDFEKHLPLDNVGTTYYYYYYY
jgi:hypothetical protein